MFSDCGGFVTYGGKGWSETILVELLAQRIAFYEALRDRRNGRFAEFYWPAVRVLTAAREEIQRRSILS